MALRVTRADKASWLVLSSARQARSSRHPAAAGGRL